MRASASVDALGSRPEHERVGSFPRRSDFALGRSWVIADKDESVASVDLEMLSVRELLALWASALRELRERGVIRTFNNTIADIAEELMAIHYGGERGSFSQKTWDVRVGDELLQVKALRDTGNRTRRNLSPIRSDDGYTAVIVVIFTEDLRVAEAIRIPREIVNEMFERRSHVNGRIVRFSRRLLANPAVERIELSDASRHLIDRPHAISSRNAAHRRGQLLHKAVCENLGRARCDGR
jgi:hypothetical protein